MTHLTPEELIDLADGAHAEASERHLVSCDVCRRELEGLRATMGLVTEEVPEPSPLFWDHLSTRIRDAVNAEPERPASWFERLGLGWTIVAPVTAGVMALLVAAVALRVPTPAGDKASGGSSVSAARVPGEPATAVTPATPATPVMPVMPVMSVANVSDASASADDSAWTLMGDLATGLDWDAAAEAGLVAPVGAADRVLDDLTPEESRELQRLLQQELARTGAKGRAS